MQGGHRHQRTLSRRVGPLHPGGSGGASAPSTASAATLLGASAVSLSVASESEWCGGAVAPALPITPSSCPSLSGQLLRQSLSRYLRTQVMHAHSAVVLFGFNSHDFDEDEDIPIRKGKLCYVCITQSELVLLDASRIGFLSSSVVIPTFDDLLPPTTAKPGATCLNVPFYLIEELVADSEREDQFQIVLVEDKGKHLPTSLVLSSVHRKALCENLIALYNAHFLTASLLSGAGNAALAHLHPHVAAAESRRQAILREIERERKRKKQSNPKRGGKTKKKKSPTEGAEGEESSSSEDDALEEDDEDEDLRPPLTGGFSVLTTSANAGVVADQVRTLRLEFEHSDLPHAHPAEQFLARLPPAYDYPAPVPASEDGPPPPAPRNVMHRAGYMWLMRPGWSEREREKRNRPCATYNFQDPEEVLPARVPFEHRKHMLSCFLPEKAISAHTHTTRARDLRGVVPGRALGKATLRELFRGREDCSDHDFFLWVESVARAVAMTTACHAASPLPPQSDEEIAAAALSAAAAAAASSAGSVSPIPAAARGASPSPSPNGSSPPQSASPSLPPLLSPPPAATLPSPYTSPPDYLIAQSLTYSRKVNPVGDKAGWVCFKVHLVCPGREVGVIAARRRYLPPYFDTFQDCVFVVFGTRAAPGEPLHLEPGFMSELEQLVDTLSPTVVPLPYHYAGGLDAGVVHPTYGDGLLLQARMNALLFSAACYAWLGTRPWLRSVPAAGAGAHASLDAGDEPPARGIFPTCEFLGTPAYKLACAFANAILVRVSHREERLAWSEHMAVVVEGIGTDGGWEGSFGGGGGGRGAEEGKHDSETLDDSLVHASHPDASSGRQSAVDDPMDIVERMVTEFVAHEEEMRRREAQFSATNDADASSSGTASASSSSIADGAAATASSTRASVYTSSEEWRARLALYLYHVVDEGAFPGALHVRRVLNVITGNMVAPPIISWETANKLERVVDFLLYIKRRPGPALDLPSLYSPEKLQAQEREKAEAAALSSAAVVLSLAAVSASGSPFAALPSPLTAMAAAAASLPKSSAASDLSYAYEPHRSLLQKVRDEALMANFTCNESMMVQLLDANYFEYLENAALGGPEHSDVSVLPSLLCALLNKDYNVALVRAVCDKIILNQIQFDGFIPPLIALAKDGSFHSAVYCLRALSLLARFFPHVIFDYGGVALGMWHICKSKSEDLLEAAIDMILELVNNENIHSFGQSCFIAKLVDILRPRVGQKTRYRGTVLQKTCSLLLKFSQVPSLLSLCLENQCHQELVDIISQPSLYGGILLEVSACLGQMYLNAGGKILAAPSQTAVHDASILVRTLDRFNNRETLRLCVNLLIILQSLIRLPRGYYSRLSNTRRHPSTGAVQFTQPDGAFSRRIMMLQHICDEDDFASVLAGVVATADSEEKRCETALELSGAIQMIDGRRVITADTSGSDANQLEDWYLGRRKIALNVKKKSKWFTARISLAINADWNVNVIWQKDNTKQFLAVPKG